ncbi:Wadjet anti-phage system protein JetD domain-containing protein [Polaribacter butkevichii]|uniref:Wadjet protein JetD C-terminal domain-containing protein n=1 Tax=Polaribacter butkevichii TaxID=218490 RepID=A0A2P6CCY4_9FLAO|nr:Wadjet anti-phage system protein JetD domain-containing protein [Polaribacter butkevichii]PQJ72771.1 hypothetical protein BTO14_05650 [Polaribacter butkevichii]
MITPKEIKIKASRKYTSVLQSLVLNKPFEKLIIRGDKKYQKDSLQEFEKEILLINSLSKEKKGFGYTLEFQQVKTKHLGTQDLPTSIYFETKYDYLKFLGKEKEEVLFLESTTKIKEAFPELEPWILKNPLKVIQNQAEWDGILSVCSYFKQTPNPNIYIRELPINVHTKFIENNQGIIKDLLDSIILDHIKVDEKLFEKRFNLKYAEPQIRFKILDKTISERFFNGLEDIATPINQFETLNLPIERVIVLENKTTFYTALTLPEIDKTITIFGSGFSVSNLKNVSWFKDKTLLYWGDLDAQGFEILSQFRGYFPQTKSIFMDKFTFDKYYENEKGTTSNITTSLHLTHEEQELYNYIKAGTLRLEQEKIPFDYVNEYFNKM